MADSGLDQLIETEHRLTNRLTAATAEANAIVAAARLAAEEAARRFEVELAAAAEELAARVQADRETEIVTIRRTTEREAARLASLPAETITALATSLLDRAIALRDEEPAR